MKIDKISLDKLILEVLKEQEMNSVASGFASPDTAKSLVAPTPTTEKPVDKAKEDPKFSKIPNSSLQAVITQKKKVQDILSKINTVPLEQIQSEVETLISVLGFADQARGKPK